MHLAFSSRFPWLLVLVLLSSAVRQSSQQTQPPPVPKPAFDYEPFFYPNIRTPNQRSHNSDGRTISQRSYETQPPPATPLVSSLTMASLQLNNRAQPTHYRDFYRNRNYYVKQTKNLDLSRATTQDKPTTPLETQRESSHSGRARSAGENIFPSYFYGTSGNPYHRKQFAPSARRDQWAATPGPKLTMPTTTEDDGPIVFSEPRPMGAYIRPVEVPPTTPHITSNFVDPHNSAQQVRKDTNANGMFVPHIDDKGAPACAKNAAYCETFDSYPKDILNRVLSQSFTPQAFQQVYGETTDNSTTTTDLKVLERTSLTSSNTEETPLCSSVEHTIYPRVARNKENKWMYVVNHDEYIQGVRVEKCLDEGQACVFGDTSPAGYQTACRQKYIYKKLLALTPEGKTSTDTFKLPSCCVCFVKKVALADRWLGGPQPTSSSLRSSSPESAGVNVNPAPEAVVEETALHHDGVQSDEPVTARSSSNSTSSHTTSPGPRRRSGT